MGIRQISIGLAAAALLGTTPVMAAAPVTPSVAKLSLAPGANLAVGSRVGAHKSARSSDIAGGGAVIAVLAAAAVAGGVVAATNGGSNKNASGFPTSP